MILQPNNMTNSKHENSQNINVLEIRNYLLKPNSADSFGHYFNTHFVAPMDELRGYTLGQYKIKGVNDRFVWLRGFTNMHTRVEFLNDFYINSPTWREYGKGANEMMINSDNVYLLRPLHREINRELMKSDKALAVVDFYICNSTLDKVIELFDVAYIPFLKTLHVEDISVWVSEMAENDFPALPVFQDKNLLVTITNYEDENEYRTRQEQINSMPDDLKKSMQQLITTRHNLILLNLNSTH